MHRSQLLSSLTVTAALALLLLGPSASATTFLHLTDTEQAERSTAVVVATVLSAETTLDDRFDQPWTRTDIQVEEVLAGSAPRTLSIQQVGGTVGDITFVLHGDASLQPGERCVLFVRYVDGGWFLTNLEESKYSLVDTHEGTFLERSVGAGRVVLNDAGAYVSYEEPQPPAPKTLDALRQSLQKGETR